jgi:hypothetical protein
VDPPLSFGGGFPSTCTRASSTLEVLDASSSVLHDSVLHDFCFT